MDIRSAQDLLLRFKRANAVRSAMHQRQVVLVRQKHGCNEDRVPMDIRSAQDLLLRFERSDAIRFAKNRQLLLLFRSVDRFDASWLADA